MIEILTIFLSGLLYTSFFTAPLSVFLLVSMDLTLNPYFLAAIAGLGAVIGDLFIIRVFRTLLAPFSFIRHQKYFRILKYKLKKYHLDFVAFILGSIIVASPLPDELGLILFGVTKLSYSKIALLTFFLNGLGILMIVLTARALR